MDITNSLATSLELDIVKELCVQIILPYLQTVLLPSLHEFSLNYLSMLHWNGYGQHTFTLVVEVISNLLEVSQLNIVIIVNGRMSAFASLAIESLIQNHISLLF